MNQFKQINTIDTDVNYHPLTSQIYPANFLDKLSDFEKHKKNEFNRMSEDNCYNQRKDSDNDKKLKYMTNSSIDLLESKDKLNFFGIGIRDGLNVPGESIDTYSSLLNGTDGGRITNDKYKSSFGQLPLPTLPYKGQLQHGDINIEDSIRNAIEVKKNSCLPKDADFQSRSFAIFDSKLNIEVPDASKSVEYKENGFYLGRNGESSRFENRFESNSKFNSNVSNIHNLKAYNSDF